VPGVTAPPTVAGYVDLRPAPGGNSQEIFLARREGDDTPCVLRVYGAGERSRGPEAPGVHAGVLRLVRGLVPAPRLLEVRQASSDSPALVATTHVAGEILNDVLATASPELTDRLGRALGEALGRLSGIAMTGPGAFHDDRLRVGLWEEGSESLLTWWRRWEHRRPLAELPATEVAGILEACTHADELLAAAPRACLVHGDLTPRNVLCDPATGEITALIDWEFTAAGHPMEDAGHLLREQLRSGFATAVLEALNPWLPRAEQADVETLRRRARAADLYRIIEMASRRDEVDTTRTAHRILRAVGRTRDLLGDCRSPRGAST
jgi:aminoglycoside phosphotransferase (APT) family kinase protein